MTRICIYMCISVYAYIHIFFWQNWNDTIQCSVCFTVIYGFWGFLSFTSFPIFLLSEFSRVNLYFLDIRRIVFFFTKHYIKARSSENRRKPTMTRYLPCYKAAKVWNVAGHTGPTANGIHRPNLSLQPPLFLSCCYIFSFGPKVLIIAVEHPIFFLLCSFLWYVPSAPASLDCLPRATLVSDLFSPPPSQPRLPLGQVW